MDSHNLYNENAKLRNLFILFSYIFYPECIKMHNVFARQQLRENFLWKGIVPPQKSTTTIAALKISAVPWNYNPSYVSVLNDVKSAISANLALDKRRDPISHTIIYSSEKRFRLSFATRLWPHSEGFHFHWSYHRHYRLLVTITWV